MKDTILGIHHITAIAGDAQRNYDFYKKVLGLRLVKKTVNFDDPGTYHFYYGDEQGTPGTILTFFPWQHIKRGVVGNGMASAIAYAVPESSFEFWKERFAQYRVKTGEVFERMGEQYLPFQDPDGLQLYLVAPPVADKRNPWTTPEVPGSVATRGFNSVELMLKDAEPTGRVLTDIFGYKLEKQDKNVFRFSTDAIDTAARVDIVEKKNGKPGIVAGGTNHHVAFRVRDEETLMHFREKVEAAGLHITPKIDRNYFYSLYFREPGGVLFEIATDNPGFAVDEPVNALGTSLKLPPQYEVQRERIEKTLPVING